MAGRIIHHANRPRILFINIIFAHSLSGHLIIFKRNSLIQMIENATFNLWRI
jgi:hypothetical protein